MSLLDVLMKAGGAAAEIVDLLCRIRERAPETAAEVGKVLDALNHAILPENIVSLAESLPRELANIAQGQLAPRRHPSDIA